MEAKCFWRMISVDFAADAFVKAQEYIKNTPQKCVSIWITKRHNMLKQSLQ